MPAENSPMVSAELRKQFQAVANRFATVARVEL
jgi:hypothetical protein